MSPIVPPLTDPHWDECQFAAEMTARQFRAIRLRLGKETLLDEVQETRRFLTPRAGKKASPSEIRRWLVNAWNTEHVLSKSEPLLVDAGGAILQWVFPQAYYAAFASTLAFFQTAGFTEESHASIQKRFAKLVVDGEYPLALSFAATGTRKNPKLHNLNPATSEPSTIHFSPSDPMSIDRKIAQFLRSTREIGLEGKREDLKLKTLKRKPRKRLSEEHWKEVAERLGPTVISHEHDPPGS